MQKNVRDRNISKQHQYINETEFNPYFEPLSKNIFFCKEVSSDHKSMWSHCKKANYLHHKREK